MTQIAQISLKLLKYTFWKVEIQKICKNKFIQKPNKTNITSLLDVLLLKMTQNGTN
jgi:hypothetical protein